MRLTDEQREWLSLAMVPGIGTAHFVQLLARFRTPHQILNASESALHDVVGPKLAERVAHYRDVVDAAAQERRMAEYNAQLITLDDASYPVRLAEIYNPPLVLFMRGALFEADQHCVAVVGTRRPTPYGIRMAERLGGGLAARGITVVSGMAAGIDAAAHRGALDAGGRTIAILGNGVDVVYPPAHGELMDRIIQHGCVLSEFEMGTAPSKGNFPHRNRIISGMTLGTVIVEAPIKSGALITAKQAAEQGREVFAVPGQVGVHNAEGPHSLIREGAKLVETVEDILVELELPAEIRQPSAAARVAPPPVEEGDTPAPRPEPAARPKAETNDVEKDVLSVLSPDGSFVDEIAQACRISVSEALSSLTMLELKGLVRQFSGKRFAPR
ncbi:MAG TPA: DNA-processing protein DprA [Candidatus Hydrogenedentes bacterium]|nr:DNA-processing protein DprA [Candidatus Hydrogenedentota bacterium]HPG67641.1 DNA-processing protein DprA [Candidatus Hydrogenedentota bacterium]